MQRLQWIKMADVLPINFPLPTESAIASYSYTDVLNGLGYQHFYLGGFEDNGGITYKVIDTAIYGDPLVISGTKDSTDTFTFYSNVFNAPRTIYGTCYYDYSIMNDFAGGQNPGTAYITLTFYHYDGTTSTSLGSCQGKASIGNTAPYKNEMANELDLTQKRFNIGDQIKITVALTSSGGSAATSIGRVAIDPAGRTTYDGTSVDFDDIHSTFNIYVPFKLNL